MTNPLLTGDRCRCAGCRLSFLTTLAFDLHRAGNYANGTRQCLPIDALLTKGFTERGGFWRQQVASTTKWPKDLTNLAAVAA